MSWPRSVVVTGGCGAIGSRLIARVLQEPDVKMVTAVDDMSSGHRWLLPDNPRLRIVESDVCELEKAGVVATDALVFHLAAFFANQNSVDHPKADLHTNGLGTLSTLLWARNGGARRVVYASAGCSIAGHDVDGPISEDLPVSLHLDTPYQITKALGEFYCNYFARDIETVRCRFFNSYGPGEVPGPYRNVIPNFIWRAMHDQELLITGTGEETRDFIYIDDLVEGLCLSGLSCKAPGSVFNLGTGHQTKIVDMASKVIELCGSKSSIVYAERRAWDHSTHREADIGLAEETLGFRPSWMFEEGLASTVDWFRNNADKIGSSLVDAP